MTLATAKTTFRVSKVKLATEPLEEIPYAQAIQGFLGTNRVEACSESHGPLVAGVSYRKLMVAHEGRPTIIVVRNGFVMGSPNNEWPGVFGEFSRVIHDHVGKMHEVIAADFSTTGAVERAASEVALMDVVQAFFKFEVRTRCGIPSITLEGSVDDWKSIARRVRELRRFDLGKWVDALEPILEKFISTAAGNVDVAFWDSIYKWYGPAGSGSPYVTGWVLNLFPYLDNPKVKFARSIVSGLPEASPMKRQLEEDLKLPALIINPWLGITGLRDDGPGRDVFPAAPSKAPFVWDYYSQRYNMEFAGGLFGVRQEPGSLALRAEIGWAVLHAG